MGSKSEKNQKVKPQLQRQLIDLSTPKVMGF